MNTLAPFCLLFYVMGLSLGVTVLAQAQEPRVMNNPSAREIIERLSPPPPPAVEPQPLTRSLSRGVAIEKPVEKPVAPPSIDLAINFEFASARLTPDARIVLDNLGQALADPALSESRFRIAGHTDAVGSDAVNLSLSRQRAQAVAEYLSRQHSVATSRLAVEGHGRSQLLDTANPASALNRRVQIVNLGK
jgi:outer membrane protein OmpA-like peptidoglycan-associated protein